MLTCYYHIWTHNPRFYSVVKVWKFALQERSAELSLQQRLHGHGCKVTCVDVSRTWSIALSGGADGRSFVWDLNRLCFVRRLKAHPVALVAVRINDVSGELLTASAQGVRCYSINGVLLSYVPHTAGSPLTALAMPQGPEWLDSNVVGQIVPASRASTDVRVTSLVFCRP